MSHAARPAGWPDRSWPQPAPRVTRPAPDPAQSRATGRSLSTSSTVRVACSLAAIVLIAAAPVGLALGVAIGALLAVGTAGRTPVPGDALGRRLDVATIAALHAAVAWHVLRVDVDERWVLLPLAWMVVAAAGTDRRRPTRLLCLAFVTLGWTGVFLGAYAVALVADVVLRSLAPVSDHRAD